MRRFPLTAAAIVALALAACSKEPAKQPVEAASAAPVVETPAPPAPPTAEVVEASAAPEAAPAPIPIATKPRAPPERVIRVIPARERRIHALINNAIARDVTGQTEHDAEMWEATRAACKTQACVDRAYAAQETELRKWEGSEAIP